MPTAEMVNPLTDHERHPRTSFPKFVKSVKAYVERFGKEELLLTYAPGQGDLDEAIDPEELDKPRTGFYRARLKGMPQRIETQYIHSVDVPPKDPRTTIDAAYQALNETLTVRLGLVTQQLMEVEGRLKTERDLRFAAEDELRLAKQRIAELEAALSEVDEPILDESTATLLRAMFGDFLGFDEMKKTASATLDAIDADEHARTIMLEKCPQVLLLLARAAGEDDGMLGEEEEP